MPKIDMPVSMALQWVLKAIEMEKYQVAKDILIDLIKQADDWEKKYSNESPPSARARGLTAKLVGA